MDNITAHTPLPFSGESLDAFISDPSSELIEELKTWDDDILVLGAGGKMGLHLSLMLKKGFMKAGKKNRVIAVSRFQTLNSECGFLDSGIETIAGDLLDEDFLNGLPTTGTVFYLAGAKFGTAGKPEILNKMNVELPARVAERFKDSRIIAFSTGCVYSFTGVESGGSKEADPVQPKGDYAISCVGRENAFGETSKKWNTPVVLIRLNYSVEVRYGVLVDICERVIRGEPLDVSMGHVNAIWQGDALDHIIRSAYLAASPAVPINITGADVIKVRDLAREFGERLSKKVEYTGEEAKSAWLSNASWSHDLFGKPRTSVGTMVEWVAEWLRTEGETFGKPTGFERRSGEF